jgi:hypothetical protein
MEIVRTFNKEVVEQLMKQRGYGMVSQNTTHRNGEEEITYNYAKSTDLGIALHASVHMKAQMISLDMVELKYFAALSMKRFDFFHKDFEKIEKILYLYSRACLDLGPHVIKLAEGMDKVENTIGGAKKLPALIKVKGDEEKVPAVTIEERKKAFWADIIPIAKQKGLSKDYAINFYRYWTEHGAADKKFRKEKETSFDISRRLDTFIRNDKEWKDQRKNFVEKKADEQDQVRNNKTVIDKKTLF